MAGGVGAFVAGLVIVQQNAHSPLQHFDWLGYIAIAIFIMCIFLVGRVNRLLESRKLATAH
jgi:hypothetical protein